MKRNQSSGNGTVTRTTRSATSKLEIRYSQFKSLTGSALTQSDVELVEEMGLSADDVRSGLSPEDPRVQYLINNGFQVVRLSGCRR